jgi:hypothetical protein
MRNKYRSRTCRKFCSHRSSVQPSAAIVALPEWTQSFALADLGDPRLSRRHRQLLADFSRQPLASIPQATGSWSQAQAAYRFFDNDNLSMHNLLASHQQTSVERIAAHPLVLAVQDTSFLNFTPHPDTDGLGPIGSHPDGSIGLLLHSTLALTPQGEPLGLLDAQCWARDPKQFGSKRLRHRRPLDEKESRKWLDSLHVAQKLCAQWPQTQVVHLSDCESDIYELFALAGSCPNGPAVLVRARHNRVRAMGGAHPRPKPLFDLLHSQTLAGEIIVTVPRRPGQKQRLATLAIRFTAVTLPPPSRKAGQAPISLWAVEAYEMHAPRGVKPICWRLLTTLAVESFEQAVEKVQWYAMRWRIEEFHRVLKSGCRAEDRQLQTVDRLQRALALDLVVAWRILLLTKQGRGADTCEQPATTVVSEEEWQVLHRYFRRAAPRAGSVPAVREVVVWIGRLGGFLARKRDGHPGPMVLWRGLHRLHDMMIGAELFASKTGSKHV